MFIKLNILPVNFIENEVLDFLMSRTIICNNPHMTSQLFFLLRLSFAKVSEIFSRKKI